MLQIETNGLQVEQKQKAGGGALCDVPPPAEKWGQVVWAGSPASR